MTRDDFRELIEGTLALWQVEARAGFDTAALRCEIRRNDQTLAVLGYELSAIGSVWRIEAAGQRPRTHLSIVPALASLRDALCPQRPRGRAMFVAALSGEQGAAP